MLFAFFNFMWVFSFYEYFVDRDYHKKISHKFKLLTTIYVLVATIIYAIFFVDKDLVTLNYFSIAIPLLVIPAILIFWHKPFLIKKVIFCRLCFSPLYFSNYEIISLIVGSWWWPGEYIFKTTIFGKIFPIDDVIIWYFLSTPVLIGGYEFFADNGR